LLANPPLVPLASAKRRVTVLPMPTFASAKVPVPLTLRVSDPTRGLSVPSAVTAAARPSKVLSDADCPVIVSALRVIVAALPALAAVRFGV
jgi:hypothetical protein